MMKLEVCTTSKVKGGMAKKAQQRGCRSFFQQVHQTDEEVIMQPRAAKALFCDCEDFKCYYKTTQPNSVQPRPAQPREVLIMCLSRSVSEPMEIQVSRAK